MSACGVEDGVGKGVLWLRGIPPKQAPVMGEEFMRGMVEKVKSALGKLGEGGLVWVGGGGGWFGFECVGWGGERWWSCKFWEEGFGWEWMRGFENVVRDRCWR
jgi:hypothetical protein